MSRPDVAFPVQVGARAIAALVRAGVIAPVGPGGLVGIARALRLGVGPATLVALAAARDPGQRALVDERGAVTYGELDRRVGAAAAALREELALGPGRGLAVMCRNHRGFVEALLAGSRLGADLLLLNTEFPAPQLAKVLERERPAAVVHDAEFAALFEDAGFRGPRVVAWSDGAPAGATLDALVERDLRRPPPTRRAGRVVILTSGTTGVPKSAPRTPEVGAMIGPMTTLLSQVPLRADEPMLVAPPFFHGFGLAYLSVGLLLRSTVVMRRRFDAEAALAAIDEHRVTALVAVPVMLQRILQCPEAVRRRYDASSLRAVVSAGSALSPAVSTGFMDAFGDVVYNLYGSTETGFGGIAGPADLRAAPGTVGRAPYGTTVTILDDERREAPTGSVGHVFIGGKLVFEGYSGGDSKEVVDGLMNTGDLGHLDREGRLFIDGREDDMIVSGGENVFPQEVADLLLRHGEIVDAAVVGVQDEDFGQRLSAFAVRAAGSQLSADEVKAYVRENLARFQVPRDVTFVEEIPRNPTGKVLLRDLAAGPQ